MSGLGHNGGPDLDGTSWRRHAWSRARAELLPVLPVEVVRLRVRRAKALGLPYRTYAGIRAASGHDLVGFLFSDNALRLTPRERLEAMAALRHGLVRRDDWPGLHASFPAPGPHAGWAETRQKVRSATTGHPADRFLLLGAAPWERGWAEAGALAGYLDAATLGAAGA